jgi:hypothetical protein
MLFQAHGDNTTVNISGGNSFLMAGVIYARDAQVKATGSAGVTSDIASAIVAKTLLTSGKGTIRVNPNNGYDRPLNWFVSASTTSGGTDWSEQL